jgi:uncharacterized protein (DUF488 family)
MNNISTLYSIGHGHKTKEEFVKELKFYKIQYLIDVRSIPFSKWAQHFNQGVIDVWLQEYSITYAYMGNYIGGKPQDDSCYDSEGYFDYQKMAEMGNFKEGLKRLISANEKGFRVAIMCTETDPLQCHRSKLIGRELYFQKNINMTHIIEVNKSISQDEIMKALTKNQWDPNGTLFGSCEPPYFRSCKAYKKVLEYEEFYD